MASPRARSAAPTVSAARPMAMSSWTRCHRSAWFPGGPSGTTGVSSRTRRASLRVGSSEGTSSTGAGRGRRRLEQIGAHALLAAGDDDDPVGGVAVHHEGLLAGEHPLRRLAAGAGAHGRERLAVALLAEGDGAAAGAGGQVGQQLGGAEGAGGQRGRDGGGEERAGQRDAAHLLEDDARLEQAGAGAAVLRGDEEAGPAEVDERRPERGGDPVSSSASWRSSCGLHSRSSAVRATSWSASCSSSYVKSTALPWSSPPAALQRSCSRLLPGPDAAESVSRVPPSRPAVP